MSGKYSSDTVIIHNTPTVLEFSSNIGCPTLDATKGYYCITCSYLLGRISIITFCRKSAFWLNEFNVLSTQWAGVGAQAGCEGGCKGVLLKDLISALRIVLPYYPNEARTFGCKWKHWVRSYTVCFPSKMPRCYKDAEMSDIFPPAGFRKIWCNSMTALLSRAFFSWCKLLTPLKVLLSFW